MLTLFKTEYLAGLFIWGSGSLSQQGWTAAAKLAPVLVAAALAAGMLARPLALLGLDDAKARSLGLSVATARLAALSLAVVLSVNVVSAVGVIGGWLVGVGLIGLDGGAFWSQMQGGVDVWADVGNGIIKSAVFGFAVTFIALLQGYLAQPTPEGVSRATTRTVVMASLTVLGLDFVLTAMMFSI